MKPYLFDLERSAEGLPLNRFLHSLTVPANRKLFAEDPEAAMRNLSEEEKAMVRNLDWRAMMEHGASFFCIEKLARVKGVSNPEESIDMVSLAILMGATFVGRSFSGDKHQLVPLIKAAMDHKGAAFLDVVSPCVAFNNHPGSTKSYDYVREHNEALNRIDFIETRDEITTQYDPGTLTTVQQHDGSILRLRKLGEEYDPSDKIAAMKRVQESLASGEVVTGLLYVDPTPKDLHHHLNTVEAPLNTLDTPDLCPGPSALDRINASLR